MGGRARRRGWCPRVGGRCVRLSLPPSALSLLPFALHAPAPSLDRAQPIPLSAAALSLQHLTPLASQRTDPLPLLLLPLPLSPRPQAIHVGAAAPSLPPALVAQLAAPGRIFIPLGPADGAQAVWQIDKDARGEVTQTRLYGVRYVPLTGRREQVQGGEEDE